MQISCDKCKHEYELTKSDIKFIIIADVDVEYLECPECNNRCIIVCKDDYMRRVYKKFMKLDPFDIKARSKSLKRMKRHSDKLKKDIAEKIPMFMEET